MHRVMLKSKIHRLMVTDANIDYEGSITIDEDLMDVARLLQYEQVHIYNLSNGARFETYAIKGERGSGEVCINGAAALLTSPGDKVIIASYIILEEEEARQHQPVLVYVDEGNRVMDVKAVI